MEYKELNYLTKIYAISVLECGLIEVKYRAFPYWKSRVAVYTFEEFKMWMDDMFSSDNSLGVEPEIFLENFESFFCISIENFHLEQSGFNQQEIISQLVDENERFSKIISALEKRVNKLNNIIKSIFTKNTK